jgi:hypothetical protein
MNKRTRIKVVKQVFRYLNNKISDAFAEKNETEFDWYSDGQHTFWLALNNRPFEIVRRVKLLTGEPVDG